jgi:hypothetical protein
VHTINQPTDTRHGLPAAIAPGVTTTTSSAHGRPRGGPERGEAVCEGAAAAAPPAGRPGVLICATTGRDLEPVPDYAPSIRDIWAPKFPRADLVPLAASQFRPLPAWKGEEGPRWRITISPGAVSVGSKDLARAERTYDRQAGYVDEATGEVRTGRAHRAIDVNAAMRTMSADDLTRLAAYVEEHGCFPWESDIPVREITEWSRRSRARMFRTFCELDFGPLLEREGIPAMVTLTYPGDWLTVAPSGKAVKRHLKAFRKRWERAWGQQILAIWKEEFQDRGAPHIHLFTVVPDGRSPEGEHFRQWLSAAWADVVGHPDPEERRKHGLAGTGVDYAVGLRSRDPRRIAVYFSKHGLFGAKEYQNEVPPEWKEPGRGPGRFWGFWGLKKCTAVVELAPHAAALAARTMRRWAHAQGVTYETSVPRTRGGAVQADGAVIGLAGAELVEARKPRKRKVRRRTKRMRNGRGWVALNDAPAFALDLARYLDSEVDSS